ncbi:SDR family NAD(P)-dependent oxidoreductase [Oerskovia sp. Sa1BUA8]|uniref:SDR family NAD(P)-dependent oxidoreductase n=1 Tax=Oerskovia douganii TaxID=2762210 RepID=A0A9D5UEN7_9CELL|nr:SDR family NAD(P)-dependent oxidoreductase [Oerskovia douganii]MBE7701646.1 SDR family NAD(P)-dependent oxidoreductase [Oerskovia douganii]
MARRTIVITGASDGIGAAAARRLSEDGHEVVVVGRSPEKTAAVARELGADFLVADFARLSDVRALAEDLLERYERIDVLANNAGGIMADRQVSEDGHELTFQVNHLAPFLLTTLLLDRLEESRASVISTSSAAHRLFSDFHLDDLESERGYAPNTAYGNAKLAVNLFTRELDRRYRASGISAAAFHPGVVATNFAATSTSSMRVLYQSVLSRFLTSSAKGADTLVWLATSTPGVDWEPGNYFVKRKVAATHPLVGDARLAAELWDVSAAMVADAAEPGAAA